MTHIYIVGRPPRLAAMVATRPDQIGIRSGPVRARDGSLAADRGGSSTPPPLRSAPCSPRARARPWRLLALRSAFAECAKLCCTAGVAQSVARASASALGRAARSRTLFFLCTPPSTAPIGLGSLKVRPSLLGRALRALGRRLGVGVAARQALPLLARRPAVSPLPLRERDLGLALAASLAGRAAPCGSDTDGGG